MYLLFPFLLCLFPIHTIYAENYVEIDKKEYFFTIFITCVALFVTISILNSLVHNWVISEWCVVFNYFAFLYANYAFIGLFSSYKRSLMKTKIFFALMYILLCVIVSFLLINIAPEKFLVGLSKFVFALSIILTAFIGMDLKTKLKALNIDVEEGPEEIETSNADYPDIYHIVTDANTGFDRPEYCDEYFRSELKKRGFHIYDKARSNYDITYCSLTSCLNMDYIHNIVPKPSDGLYTYPLVWPYYTKNKVFSVLRNRGYKFYYSVCKELAHLLDSTGSEISGNIWNILGFTSLITVFRGVKNLSIEACLFKYFRKFAKFSRLNLDSPKYAYMHFLAPHTPFLVDENGKRNKESDMMNKDKYFPYLKFVNKELLKLIDDIKSNMKPNSIILVHGDHSYPGFNEYSHKILLTAYFPEGFNPNCIKQDQTLVNLFGNIFNEVFDTDYKEHAPEYYCVAHGVWKMNKFENVAE